MWVHENRFDPAQAVADRAQVVRFSELLGVVGSDVDLVVADIQKQIALRILTLLDLIHTLLHGRGNLFHYRDPVCLDVVGADDEDCRGD